MPADSTSGPFLTGRAAEIDALRAAHATVQTGQGRCVLLAGEPGIGKTSIVEFWSAQARGSGAFVAWARCDDAEGAPPMWPWTQALRLVCDGVDADALLAAAGADARELALLLPSWQQTLGVAPATASLADPAARFRVFDGVASFLRVMARRQPLALVFDDLHNADASSLALLRFLSRRLPEMAVLIVATLRDGDLRRSELNDTIAELLRSPEARHLQLAAFTRTDVAACIRAHGGVEPSEPLTTALLARTDGNPLFVVEFVRLLVAEGLLRRDQVTTDLSMLPGTLRAIIARHLSPLSPPCRAMLTATAVAGLEIGRDALKLLLESSGSDVSDLDVAVGEAQAAHLLAPSRGDGAVRFAHAIVRDVVYAGIDPAERASLHHHLARVIEQQPDRDAHLAELALHYSRASGDDAQLNAFNYAVAAAKRAIAVAAYAEAAALYAQALEIANGIPSPDPRRRCVLLLDMGTTQHAAGDRIAARQTFQAAADSARELLRGGGDDEAVDFLARAAIGIAGGWAGGANVAQFDADRAAAFDADAVSLLEEARSALAERDTVLRAKVLSQLAVQGQFTVSRAERAALSREAVDIARRLGDPATLGHVRSIDWTVRWTPANAVERLEAADEIIACGERADDRALVIGGRFQRISALFELGEADGLQREASVVHRQATALRQPQWLWRARAHDIAVALMEGRYTAARELLRAARRDPHDDSIARLFLALQMTELQRALGETDRLAVTVAVMKAIIDQHPAVPSIRTGLAQLYVDLGQLDEARAEIEQVAARDFTDVPFDLTWVNTLAEATEVCIALADQRLAGILYDLLSPYGDRHVVLLGGAVCCGSVARLLGALASVLERWDEGSSHFDAALAANRRLGARAWVARTQVDYGELMLRRHAVEHARYFLQQAHITAEAIGMVPLATRAAGLLARCQPLQVAAIAPPEPRAATSASLERGGDFWTLTYQGREVRLRDLKGLGYLSRLLQSPGREFHVLELLQLDAGPTTVTNASAAAGSEMILDGSALAGDVVLDPKAKAEYRRRLDELRDELEEAQRWNDVGRADSIRAEMEALTKELASALGPGGRDRRMHSAAERARTTISKSIHTVIKRLQSAHPALAEHLAPRVKTGYFCVYLSDESAVTWELSPASAPERGSPSLKKRG